METGTPELQELITLAEAETGRAIRGLPGTLRVVAEAVPVLFESVPGPLIIEEGFESTLLGLFVGEAFPDEGDTLLPTPPQIHLFLENIWEFSNGNRRDYCREVRKTYLHELGHYLGLDENDLWERGMD